MVTLPGHRPMSARSESHLIVDNAAAAETVLDAERLTYTENDVAQVALPNRSGELARVASRLGEANININYAYGGVEPITNTPLLFFGVAEVSRLHSYLSQTASAAAGRMASHLSIAGD